MLAPFVNKDNVNLLNFISCLIYLIISLTRILQTEHVKNFQTNELIIGGKTRATEDAAVAFKPPPLPAPILVINDAGLLYIHIYG